MIQITSVILLLSIALITFRFFIAQNSYEKILSFHLIFTNFILLILINSVSDLNDILDIVIVFFLLNLVAVLFLIRKAKKI